MLNMTICRLSEEEKGKEMSKKTSEGKSQTRSYCERVSYLLKHHGKRRDINNNDSDDNDDNDNDDYVAIVVAVAAVVVVASAADDNDGIDNDKASLRVHSQTIRRCRSFPHSV